MELDDERKTVFLKEISQEKIIEAKILPTNTVGELKRVIEKAFNYERNYLNGKNLRLVNKGHRIGTLLHDDEKKLDEYGIRNKATISFLKL